MGLFHSYSIVTLWLFNIATENDPFIDGFPIKHGGSFHSYVSLPDGKYSDDQSEYLVVLTLDMIQELFR